MKCINHPEKEAEVLCVVCNAPICADCRVTLRGRDFCRACLEERVESVNSGISTPRNKLLAFFLSLVPGAGYMYLGLMNRGLQTMIIFFGTIFVSVVTRLDSLAPFVMPVILFYNVFDTLQLAGRMNEGVRVEDKPLVDLGGRADWHNLLGYALVGLGLLALFNNLIPYVFHDFYMLQSLVAPLIIIAIGVYILYQNLKGGRKDGGEGNV
ncbi:B-box zinc finger [Desulfotomaculum arcticum]|uniref:B-box zinc finger n=1 Tax=Desulfotruncus arcticus DSM 17038 TaxID=1121424 RepID=A0A1I2UGN0_9FIRM|nr:B-box zinc finger protein [Desulfotruncus arcticus]SFG76210.1 B-box zinc finger [Desulfotomaculum arcticum] [Desulfotruncus arcticus DSM 17038]